MLPKIFSFSLSYASFVCFFSPTFTSPPFRFVISFSLCVLPLHPLPSLDSLIALSRSARSPRLSPMQLTHVQCINLNGTNFVCKADKVCDFGFFFSLNGSCFESRCSLLPGNFVPNSNIPYNRFYTRICRAAILQP